MLCRAVVTLVTVPDSIAEPIAGERAHTWQRPTGATNDPWAWLRNRDDAIAYLEAENAYTDAWFAPLNGLVDTIFHEIKNRTQETDEVVPVKMGPWWYTTRTVEGSSYSIHCRGASRATATEAVLLDENIEAGDHEYFSLGVFEVSPDHRWLAWSSDTDGSELYTLRIRDLSTGVDLPDVVENTSGWSGAAWAGDSSMVFYLRPDEQMRPAEIWRHSVGSDASSDVLVMSEPDERFFLGVTLSRSEEWLILGAASKTSAEMWLIPANDPAATPVSVRGRTDDLEYFIDHWGDRFVVLTNLDALDFKVMTAPIDTPGEWSEFVAHVPGQRIVGIEPFANHLVVHEWANAQQRLRIVQRDGASDALHIDDEPHELSLDANPEWLATTLRYNFESFTSPPAVFELDLTSGERTLLKQRPTPNIDLDRYEASREWALAPDGTKVPVDIVRAKGTVADATAPCIVYGYGSYEESIPPWFSAPRLSLLDRGWVWALVHPRGGGELGRAWYEQGKLLNKRTTFTDTIACVEHLVAGKWARPDGVVIRGGSAGGLLVGACMTMRPDLFAGVIAEVPFVDVVSTMSDPTLPLTVTEWEEWGDPRAEPFASYLLGYSPYDNTVATEYPAVFITGGLNDPRVSFHEPAKWCAKLRALRTNDRPLIMRMEMGAGHGGPSGRYHQWREEAGYLAFAITITANSMNTPLRTT